MSEHKGTRALRWERMKIQEQAVDDPLGAFEELRKHINRCNVAVQRATELQHPILVQAQALFNLSQNDLADMTGLSRSRVQQILTEGQTTASPLHSAQQSTERR